MEILFIANTINDSRGGMCNAILNLGNSLRAAGHDVDYIFRDSLTFFKKDRPFNRMAAFLTFPIVILILILFKRLDRKYDIIDVSSGDGFLYGILAKRLRFKRHAKLVMRSHGLEHLYWENLKEEHRLTGESSSLAQRMFLPLIRIRQVDISIRECDLIICNNMDEKSYIKAMLGNCDDKRISCIPHGVSSRFFAQSAGSRRLLFVGDWNWRKGQLYLVKIYIAILRSHPDAQLSIVVRKNDGEVMRSFPEYVRDKISVFKNLHSDKMARLYASCGIFIFPSIFEGFGCAVLEAMAAGMAVVVTNDFGWSRVIKNWENGVLVEKRDVASFSKAVARLLENEALRNDIGLRASQTAKRFSWTSAADQTIACYSDLIEKK